MKASRAVMVLFILCAALTLAAQTPAAAPRPMQSAAPSLDSIVTGIQQATQAANLDIGRLRIDRWKAEATEKAQMQQIADSLRKNLTYAVPDLISEVRSSRGSVSSTFKLYHNLNVVFEYMNSLTDAAGSMGKKEEYDPLSSDATALDKARQHLSTYIEQAAASLESKIKAAASPTPTPASATGPKKIIVDDEASQKPVTAKKKKTSAPAPQPSPSPH